MSGPDSSSSPSCSDPAPLDRAARRGRLLRLFGRLTRGPKEMRKTLLASPTGALLLGVAERNDIHLRSRPRADFHARFQPHQLEMRGRVELGAGGDPLRVFHAARGLRQAWQLCGNPANIPTLGRVTVERLNRGRVIEVEFETESEAARTGGSRVGKPPAGPEGGTAPQGRQIVKTRNRDRVGQWLLSPFDARGALAGVPSRKLSHWYQWGLPLTDVLQGERLRAADATAAALQVCYELKRAGRPQPWTALRADLAYGPLARAFETDIAADPARLDSGEAMALATRRWLESDPTAPYMVETDAATLRAAAADLGMSSFLQTRYAVPALSADSWAAFHHSIAGPEAPPVLARREGPPRQVGWGFPKADIGATSRRLGVWLQSQAGRLAVAPELAESHNALAARFARHRPAGPAGRTGPPPGVTRLQAELPVPLDPCADSRA